MNVLCGYFGPTSGTAKVFGYDVRENMDAIHMLLGVCPQENILWEELTGREHLMFYGRLKGLTGPELDAAVNYRLGQVDLLQAGDRFAGGYSGGMKRRLCVAMALVGNPRVVILDEPSTGLDPKARKDLWRVIKKAANTAPILLTTHSMEEAEVLCSRIGIFMKGRLRCIGTAGELKARSGDGFYIHIECVDKETEVVDEYLRKKLEGLKLLNKLNGTYNYQISSNFTSLSKILFVLMANGDNATKQDRDMVARIQDWYIVISLFSLSLSLSETNVKSTLYRGVMNTTLEQAFVKITEEGTLPGAETLSL
jgi:ABC-type multidrug transport system ATPase subunit